jgi:hypothetical protein
MKARCVEAGQPHVAYQNDSERVSGITETVRQRLAPWLVADVRLPVGGVGCGTGHDDLDASFVVGLVLPGGAEAHEITIEIDAYAPAHADDHTLAFKGFKTLFEMVDNVLRNEPQALLSADNRFELRPFCFELLLALDLKISQFMTWKLVHDLEVRF